MSLLFLFVGFPIKNKSGKTVNIVSTKTLCLHLYHKNQFPLLKERSVYITSHKKEMIFVKITGRRRSRL